MCQWSCCSLVVVGAGNAPGALRVNVVCGDPLNLSFRRCDGWPDDTIATLVLTHPWGWEHAVLGAVADEWLSFHVPAVDAVQIPRDANARIRLASPGVPPYTWLAGRVSHAGAR